MACRGFLGMFWVGVFAAGYPTGINNVESSIGGQLMGMVTFLPLGFLSGWVAALILKKLNVLRVPVAVELEGLDLVEYGTLVYPEMGVIKEQIVEPDGTLVESAIITQLELTNGHDPSSRGGRRCSPSLISLVIMFAVVGASVQWAVRAERRRNLRRTAMPAIIDSAPDCIAHVAGAKPADDSADFIIQAAYEKCAGIHDVRARAARTATTAPAPPARTCVLTWIGIAVMVAVLVYWVCCGEPRRLHGHRTRRPRGGPRPKSTRRRQPMAATATRQIEFPPLQTHSRKFELAMIGLSIVCMIVVLDHRAVHEHRHRVPPDGLDRLTSHPVPSEAVDQRPIRVRIDPPPEEPPSARAADPARPAGVRRAVRASALVAAQSCQQAQIRITKERAIAIARPEAGFTPERTQVRLVRQGLNGRPFWAVSFSVPAPVRRRLLRADDRARRRQQGQDRGRQPGASRRGSSSPSRLASHGAGRCLEQQRRDDRERDDAREQVDVRHAEAREHADERRRHDAGLARPAQERELGARPARAPVGQRAREHRDRPRDQQQHRHDASDGAQWSASVPNGSAAPTTRKTKIVTTSASVREEIRSSSSLWLCMTSPSSSMLPTIRPARNAPR